MSIKKEKSAEKYRATIQPVTVKLSFKQNPEWKKQFNIVKKEAIKLNKIPAFTVSEI